MVGTRKPAAWWSFVGILGLVLGSLLGLAAPAQAQASEATHWTHQRSDARATQFVGALSCVTMSHCTAVTDAGSALAWNGQGWSRPRAADRDVSTLQSVSCPTATFCAAAGGKVAVVERDGRWGKVRATRDALNAVSCVSARWCLAVGRSGVTLHWDGSSWRRFRSPTRQAIASVSCTSTSFCMAAEYSTDGSRMFRWTGTTWRSAGRVAASISETGELSCGSSTLCMGVDGATARWNGHRWVAHHFPWAGEPASVDCGATYCRILTSAHAVQWHRGWGAVDRVSGGGPLSCPTRGRCLATGANGSDGKTLTLSRGTWSSGPFPATPHFITRLSCPTATFCMGLRDDAKTRVLSDGTWHTVALPVGTVEDPQAHLDCTSASFCMLVTDDGHVATWDGSAWSEAAPLGGWDPFDCVSASYCVALDGSVTQVWNGSSWTASGAITDDLDTISCAARDDCWAGTAESGVAHYDGATWSATQRIAPMGIDDFNTVTIVCPSTTTCVAGDERGNVFSYHGHWSKRTHVGVFSAIDCGSATSCTTASRGLSTSGYVSRWNGTTWSTSRALPNGYLQIFEALSCPTRSVCFLADDAGNVWKRT